MVVCTVPWISPESASNAPSALAPVRLTTACMSGLNSGLRSRAPATAPWLGVCATDAKVMSLRLSVRKTSLGVVGRCRRQKGEMVGDTREWAEDAPVRGQDGVSGLPRIGLVLRQPLPRPAGERGSATRDDLVRLPGGIGLDLIGRTRLES